MATRKIALRPGVDAEKTPTLLEAGFSDCNCIRFFNGMVEKLGGYAVFNSANPPMVGTCRGLFAWGDFQQRPYLAAGTEQRLYTTINGALTDITPIVHTSNVAVAFTTTLGSPVVTITDATYTPGVGDWVFLATQVSVGGIVLSGYYRVTASVSGTQYQITAATPATAAVGPAGAVPVFGTTVGLATIDVTLADHSLGVGDLFNVGVPTTVSTVAISGAYSVQAPVTATDFVITAGSPAAGTTSGGENGGNVRIAYLLASGVAVNTPSAGWGAGDWGAGDWGGSAPDGDDFIPLRCWSFTNWGQDMIAGYYGGSIYSWSPPTPIPAAVVPGAPSKSNIVVGVAQAQILVALGAETGGTQFPTLVRWCDSGNRTAWVASATNQAGSFQLPTGSEIVAGLSAGLGVLIWTDEGLWSMTYQGLPFVFGFNKIGVSCEALSMRAPVAIGSRVIWPSDKGFFNFDGSSVKPLDCPVWSWMFDNMDLNQTEQVHGALNTLFGEVAWHFPIDVNSPIYDPAAPIGYVKLQYEDGLWDKGQSVQYQRTAWVDHSPVGNPIGADLDGLLQQHEVSADANGSPLIWFWRTGYAEMDGGGSMQYIDQLQPDFHEVLTGGATTAVKQITILGQDFAAGPVSTYGPYVVDSSTQYLNVNIRGKQLAIQVGGSDLGTSIRLGAIRARVASSGRR